MAWGSGGHGSVAWGSTGAGNLPSLPTLVSIPARTLYTFIRNDMLYMLHRRDEMIGMLRNDIIHKLGT